MTDTSRGKLPELEQSAIDARHGWAIIYGDILDGVTQNETVAEEARHENALVIPISWDGDAILWQHIIQALRESSQDQRSV